MLTLHWQRYSTYGAPVVTDCLAMISLLRLVISADGAAKAEAAKKAEAMNEVRIIKVVK